MIKTNLAVLMAERGLKIADVYKATGISKTTLMAISENNGKGIQYETMDKLCNYFGVTPAEFFSYAPYMFKFYMTTYKNDLPAIHITVTHQNKMRTYEFRPFIISPKGIDFPVTEKDASFIVSYNFYFDIEKEEFDSSKGERLKNSFYNMYDSLPISLKSELNNHFYSIVTDSLSSLNGGTIETLDGSLGNDLAHDVKVNSGDNVIIEIFNGRDSRLSKIPLFVVHETKKD